MFKQNAFTFRVMEEFHRTMQRCPYIFWDFSNEKEDNLLLEMQTANLWNIQTFGGKHRLQNR